MGEKIKILSEGKISNMNLKIELNHPPVAGQDQQIHIQSDKLRFEVDKKDYLLFASSILLAEKNLRKIKGLES